MQSPLTYCISTYLALHPYKGLYLNVIFPGMKGSRSGWYRRDTTGCGPTICFLSFHIAHNTPNMTSASDSPQMEVEKEGALQLCVVLETPPVRTYYAHDIYTNDPSLAESLDCKLTLLVPPIIHAWSHVSSAARTTPDTIKLGEAIKAGVQTFGATVYDPAWAQSKRTRLGEIYHIGTAGQLSSEAGGDYHSRYSTKTHRKTETTDEEILAGEHGEACRKLLMYAQAPTEGEGTEQYILALEEELSELLTKNGTSHAPSIKQAFKAAYGELTSG